METEKARDDIMKTIGNLVHDSVVVSKDEVSKITIIINNIISYYYSSSKITTWRPTAVILVFQLEDFFQFEEHRESVCIMGGLIKGFPEALEHHGIMVSQMFLPPFSWSGTLASNVWWWKHNLGVYFDCVLIFLGSSFNEFNESLFLCLSYEIILVENGNISSKTRQSGWWFAGCFKKENIKIMLEGCIKDIFNY